MLLIVNLSNKGKRMFISFEILIDGHSKDRVDLCVSSPKEAMSLFIVFEDSPRIIAWKCNSHKPEDFGCAPSDSGCWKKLRTRGFTSEDLQ